MALNEDIKPEVAKKLLKVYLDADLHYHLNGTPHDTYLLRQAHNHYGQTRRLLREVARLGPTGAKRWMGYFIESMSEEG